MHSFNRQFKVPTNDDIDSVVVINLVKKKSVLMQMTGKLCVYVMVVGSIKKIAKVTYKIVGWVKL